MLCKDNANQKKSNYYFIEEIIKQTHLQQSLHKLFLYLQCNQITNNFVAKLNPYSKVGTNQLFKKNNIIENEDFVLLIDLLPIVRPIHLLIVPKLHIEGMANLKTKELFDSLDKITKKLFPE